MEANGGYKWVIGDPNVKLHGLFVYMSEAIASPYFGNIVAGIPFLLSFCIHYWGKSDQFPLTDLILWAASIMPIILFSVIRWHMHRTRMRYKNDRALRSEKIKFEAKGIEWLVWEDQLDSNLAFLIDEEVTMYVPLVIILVSMAAWIVALIVSAIAELFKTDYFFDVRAHDWVPFLCVIASYVIFTIVTLIKHFVIWVDVKKRNTRELVEQRREMEKEARRRAAEKKARRLEAERRDLDSRCRKELEDALAALDRRFERIEANMIPREKVEKMTATDLSAVFVASRCKKMSEELVASVIKDAK